MKEKSIMENCIAVIANDPSIWIVIMGVAGLRKKRLQGITPKKSLNPPVFKEIKKRNKKTINFFN